MEKETVGIDYEYRCRCLEWLKKIISGILHI